MTRRSCAGLVGAVACVAVVLLTGCGTSGTSSSIPSGWTSYHDTHFPFQMPIPPGWQVRTITTNQDTGDACDYPVDVFAPGTQIGSKLSALAEQIYVDIKLKCPDWRGQADDHFFVAEPAAVTISGTKATMYDNDSFSGWTQRAAVTHLGGHQYIIGMQAPPTHARQDLTIYTQLLQGFQYTGK